MWTTSPKLDTSHLSANQEADLRCRTALELKESGEDQLAPFLGAKTGAEIIAYENDDDLLVSVLWGYARLAGVSIENLIMMIAAYNLGIV